MPFEELDACPDARVLATRMLDSYLADEGWPELPLPALVDGSSCGGLWARLRQLQGELAGPRTAQTTHPVLQVCCLRYSRLIAAPQPMAVIV